MTRKTDPILWPRQDWQPRYQSAPYQPSPARREHIHGKVKGFVREAPLTLHRQVRREDLVMNQIRFSHNERRYRHDWAWIYGGLFAGLVVGLGLMFRAGLL